MMKLLGALAGAAVVTSVASAQATFDDLQKGATGPIYFSAEASTTYSNVANDVGAGGTRNISFTTTTLTGATPSSLTLVDGELNVSTGSNTEALLSLSYVRTDPWKKGDVLAFTRKQGPGQLGTVEVLDSYLHPIASVNGTYQLDLSEKNSTVINVRSANGANYFMYGMSVVPEPFVTPGILLFIGAAAARKKVTARKEKHGQIV